MTTWTQRAVVLALVTIPTAAFAASAGSGGCIFGALFGCGG